MDLCHSIGNFVHGFNPYPQESLYHNMHTVNAVCSDNQHESHMGPDYPDQGFPQVS